MNGKQIAVILAIIGAAAVLLNHENTSKGNDFENWKATHGISYDSQIQNIYRERVFLENLAKIEAHNSRNDATYEMGLNQFSAMTQEEFAQNYLGLLPTTQNNLVVDEEYTIGGDINWVSVGAVTGVKNQGSCGSCWAFSATGGLEGLSFIHGGKLQSFSEQYLVDCDYTPIIGNQGCNGGLMTRAFKYVKSKGIALEKDYPYVAKKQNCSKSVSSDYKIKGYTEIKACSTLSQELTGRPISVGVDATNWSPYKSGIFNNCASSLNHGVLLVGIKDGNWVVKNSWGTTWGELGFIRLASGNTCGICNTASYPTA